MYKNKTKNIIIIAMPPTLHLVVWNNQGESSRDFSMEDNPRKLELEVL